MPKVTHIFKTYFPETSGGLEEAIRQIGNYTGQKGFEVEVVSVAGKNYSLKTPDRITTRFFKKDLDLMATPFSLSMARAFRQICRDTDVLHFHFPWPAAELLALAHSIETPMVVTFHCDIFRARLLKTLYLPFIRRYLKKSDRVCVTSRNLVSSTPYLRPFKDKIDEIPLFLNEKRFEGLSLPDNDISALAGSRPYALFTGVLRWYKGLDVLLSAAKKIRHDIIIVGKGPLYPRLQERIIKERLDNVHLIGFQPDRNLSHLIQNARLMVLPSTTPAEAFGQVLLEGLYFSRPLVSTELGTATSRVNLNGHTGLVVKPGCSDALAGAVNRICEDDALFAKFSANAYPHYQNHFTARIQGEKYVRLYRTLLNGQVNGSGF